MKWLYVTEFINSVSVACVAVGLIVINLDLKRKQREIKRISEEVKEEKEDICKIDNKIRKLEDWYKEMHEELGGKKHEAIDDSEFIFGGWNRIKFGCGKEVNVEFLDYVAKIALTVIASELPKEIRTPEVIRFITDRIKGELEKSKVEL